MKKSKRILLISLFVIVFAVAGVAQFTSVGYMVTVPLRGFTQIQAGVYVDDASPIGDDVLQTIAEARERLSAFWGDAQSCPTIIVSGRPDKMKRMGWTGNPALTNTFVLGGAHSYVLLTPDGLNVDVVAHELSHAELHHRLYAGKLIPSFYQLVWFDEGVAIQVDDRECYNDEAWAAATDNGKNITDFAQLKTAQQFFNPDADVRRYNYIISKHEVKNWIEHNGKDALFELIRGVNAGEEFEALYSAR